MKQVFSIIYLWGALAAGSALAEDLPVMVNFGFKPLGSVSRDLLKDANETLTKELGIVNGFRHISAWQGHPTLSSQGFRPENCKNDECLVKGAKLLDGAKVIYGSMHQDGQSVDFTLYARGTVSGEVELNTKQSATLKKNVLPVVMAEFAAKLRDLYEMGLNATLVVGSTPSGVAFAVDGVEKGTTPMTIELPGDRNYEVAFFAEGRRVYATTVTLKRGEFRDLDIDLRKRGLRDSPLGKGEDSRNLENGYVVVNAEPEGAEIAFNGQSSLAPMEVSDVRPGRYTVVVEAPGYEPREETVTVGSGNNVFNFSLVETNTASSRFSAGLRYRFANFFKAPQPTATKTEALRAGGVRIDLAYKLKATTYIGVNIDFGVATASTFAGTFDHYAAGSVGMYRNLLDGSGMSALIGIAAGYANLTAQKEGHGYATASLPLSVGVPVAKSVALGVTVEPYYWLRVSGPIKDNLPGIAICAGPALSW